MVLMKQVELYFIVFLLGLFALLFVDNSYEQNELINTTNNAVEKNDSINTIQKQDYMKQFAEFSKLLIIPNTISPGQTYEVYGQLKNFLSGAGIANATISFRIFPPVIDSSTTFNVTKTDRNGNFKIQFISPNQPSFYYLGAYLTGHKNYYPTDSEPVPFVVFG